MHGTGKVMAGVAATLLATAACDVGPGTDADSSVPRFGVGEPEIRMGGIDDPDYAFGFVRAAVVGPDGRVYTLHANDAFVRRWTAEGRPDGQIGRAGEGPGEFSAPGAMGFFGDSLWVVDVRTYTATYFDLAGEYLGQVKPEVRFASREDGPTASPPRPQRPLRDGSWVGRKPAWSHEIATGELTEIPLVRMDSTGSVLDTLFVDRMRPTDILALIREDGQGGFYGRQPFGDGNVVLWDDHGVAVLERRAWTGEGPAELVVRRIGWDGAVSEARVPYSAEPLAAERVDSVVRADADRMHSFMARSRPGLTLAQFRDLLSDATYRPGYLPPVKEAFAAVDGAIWMQRFDPVDGRDVWRVLGHGGQIEREIHLPAGLRPLWSDGTSLLGVETDELDVNYIVRYRVEPMVET